MPFINANDGTELFVKDWKPSGRDITGTVVFLHSLAVSSDIWQYQHTHFLDAGYRVVAFDRRGHGRSSQPAGGYDADTLANDVAVVLTALDVEQATLIAHSMGCGEAVRYLSRHGSARIARVALVAGITPFLRLTPDNPHGVDDAFFAPLRALWRRDFPSWVVDNAAAFFAPETSQAMIDWGVALMRNTPPTVAIACNHMFVETDFRADCAAVKIPSLVIHGTADASAPIVLTGDRTAALMPHCHYTVYEGAPHGLMFTHLDRLNAELLAFASAAMASSA